MRKLKALVKEWIWIYRKRVVAACGLLTVIGVAAALTLTVQGRGSRQAEGIQQGIAKEIIRFHVIANSDSEDDQNLKMKVKEEVVAYMEQELKGATGIEDTRQRIQEHLDMIRETAEKVIKSKGYSYPVDVQLTNCYFPMKSYGDCTFPAGRYEALRVCIGEAQGKNWWCVLYPNLCFIDSIHAIVPEEQKQELANVLTEDEYESLFDWKRSDFKITTKWF